MTDPATPALATAPTLATTAAPAPLTPASPAAASLTAALTRGAVARTDPQQPVTAIVAAAVLGYYDADRELPPVRTWNAYWVDDQSEVYLAPDLPTALTYVQLITDGEYGHEGGDISLDEPYTDEDGSPCTPRSIRDGLSYEPDVPVQIISAYT
ncbi:hypothetical protein [Deinococcus kurensis]|uniref:hypothetical protein n=1 Tax=Deinococcus kurensis TaxID=2662757 RepID=UPI0012D330DB|nr:hypothetical protein [Deinococcus kurensis]